MLEHSLNTHAVANLRHCMESVCEYLEVSPNNSSVYRQLDDLLKGKTPMGQMSQEVINLTCGKRPFVDAYEAYVTSIPPAAMGALQYGQEKKGGALAVLGKLAELDADSATGVQVVFNTQGAPVHPGPSAKDWLPTDQLPKFLQRLGETVEMRSEFAPARSVSVMTGLTGVNFSRLTVRVDMRDGAFMVTDIDDRRALTLEEIQKTFNYGVDPGPVKVSAEKFKDIAAFVAGKLVGVKLDAGDKPNFSEENLKRASDIAYEIVEILEGRKPGWVLENPVARVIVERALQYFK